MSKLINSRDSWRKKAVQRANELREQRKATRRYRARIETLNSHLNELEEAVKKKSSALAI